MICHGDYPLASFELPPLISVLLETTYFPSLSDTAAYNNHERRKKQPPKQIRLAKLTKGFYGESPYSRKNMFCTVKCLNFKMFQGFKHLGN